MRIDNCLYSQYKFRNAVSLTSPDIYFIICSSLIISRVISPDIFYLKLASVVDFSTRHGCPRDVRRCAPLDATYKKGGRSSVTFSACGITRTAGFSQKCQKYM